jgi:hypothetical protein
MAVVLIGEFGGEPADPIARVRRPTEGVAPEFAAVVVAPEPNERSTAGASAMEISLAGTFAFALRRRRPLPKG